MNKSLSGDEILEALNDKTHILTYKDILKYDNIDDLLGEYENCVLLYLTSENYGHWTCLFKNNKTIYFFDSYGREPDEQLDTIPRYMNKKTRQSFKYLTYLLYKSDYNIRFSQYRLQEYGKEINTCGRWVIERLLNRNLNENEFANLFINSGINKDWLITELTKNIII